MPTRQLEHQEIHNEKKNFPISVVCDNITSPENVGMIFRISEAMGIEHIYLCGDSPTPEHKKVLKTARSTEKAISYSYHKSTLDVAETLKKKGCIIASLEITNNSIPLPAVNFHHHEHTAIVLGNEQAGVDHEVLNLSNFSIEIPMFGKNTSINVVNSLSIALYEIVKQLN